MELIGDNNVVFKRKFLWFIEFDGKETQCVLGSGSTKLSVAVKMARNSWKGHQDVRLILRNADGVMLERWTLKNAAVAKGGDRTEVVYSEPIYENFV
jgi:hypothetical protein